MKINRNGWIRDGRHQVYGTTPTEEPEETREKNLG
jgi:hypothetical protein